MAEDTDPLGLGTGYLAELEKRARSETAPGIGGFLTRFANVYGTKQATPNLDRFVRLKAAERDLNLRTKQAEREEKRFQREEARAPLEDAAAVAQLQRAAFEQVGFFQTLIADLPEEKREAAIAQGTKMLGGLFRQTERDGSVRALLTDDLVADVVRGKLDPKTVVDVFGMTTPEDRQEAVKIKDPTQRQAFLKTRTEERANASIGRIEEIARTVVPQDGILKDPRQFIPEIRKRLTPEDQRAFDFIRAHSHPEQRRAMLAGVNLADPGIIATEKKEIIPGGETIKEYLPLSPTFRKLGIPPEDIPKQPVEVRNQIAQEAKAAQEAAQTAREVTKAGATAEATVRATKGVLATLPITQAGGELADKTIRHRQTGTIFDKTMHSHNDLVAAGGEKTFALLDAKQNQAYMGLVSVRTVTLPQFRNVAKDLSNKPFGNYPKAAEAYYQRASGGKNLKTEVDLLGVNALTLARSVNAGVASQLSDRDLETIRIGIPNIFDGQGSATQKIDAFERTIRALEGVALGNVDTNTANTVLRETAALFKGSKKPYTIERRGKVAD